MRIANTIIDTDSMSIEEMDMFIAELRRIRARKHLAETLKGRMAELIGDAQAAGFDFIDKNFGYIIQSKDLDLYDNQ